MVKNNNESRGRGRLNLAYPSNKVNRLKAELKADKETIKKMGIEYTNMWDALELARKTGPAEWWEAKQLTVH